jgi:cytochrome P450
MNMNSAIVHPYDIELEHLNVADPAIFEAGQEEVYFRRLRDEAPLHYCQESAFGPYWSVTRYADIMAVDTDHARFSSAGGITIGGAGGTPMPPKTESEQQGPESRPQFDGFGMFIAMDPPKHDVQRATVASVVAPRNLAVLEGLIRERAGSILDGLPLGGSCVCRADNPDVGDAV